MRRRLLALTAVLAAALVAGVLAAPAAVAGGYCRVPKTEARGTTVTMTDNCYKPTVLRVAAGKPVTFVNLDRERHPTTAQGGEWFVEGGTGSRATVRFDQPGIYPYFCHQHLGMIGVVVVGDGRSKATAAPVQVADPPVAPAAAVAGEPAGPTAAGPVRPWSPAGALVLGAVAGGLALVLARRRRARPGAAPQP